MYICVYIHYKLFHQVQTGAGLLHHPLKPCSQTPDLAASCIMPHPLSFTVYLQHSLLLLLPPFLTLSLLIRVPRPAVSPPGLWQHRHRRLTNHQHTYVRTVSTCRKPPPHTQTRDSHAPQTHTSTTGEERERERREGTEIVDLPQQHYSNSRTPTRKRGDTEGQRWAQMKRKAVSAFISTSTWHATPKLCNQSELCPDSGLNAI